jgi:formamidopyrimidine-DNA glycosylase
MPELPEVESIKLQLQKYLIGSIVSDVQVNWQKTFPEGKEKLIGAKITAVRRFGKVLVIDFINGYSLAVHIKMTGQFIYRGPNLKHAPVLSTKVLGGVPGKHTHVIFKFKIKNEKLKVSALGGKSEKSKDKKNGAILYYNDVRKFGWMKVIKTEDIKNISLLGKMGPEPLSGLTIRMFLEIIHKNTQSIKPLLMDQAKISGVGNIYANDALYSAKIHPARKANSLSDKEGERLLNAVEEVLRRGIKAGGASENTFVTPDGTEGSYQDIALVYGKDKKPCQRCGTIIEKISLGGRGTYFCPHCQK